MFSMARSFYRLVRVTALMALPLFAQGALVWEAREIKVEAKANDREVVADYRFKNEGNTPVAIVDVVSSCDCTRVELKKRVYAPGEEGTLSARLAVEGRSGLQVNTIVVMTDESGGEPVALRLRADVQSLVALSPRVLSWRVGAEAEDGFTLVAAATSLGVRSVAIAGIFPAGAAESRVEPVAEGTQYRVSVRPVSTARTLNFTVSCLATFVDGTTQAFAIHGMAKR